MKLYITTSVRFCSPCQSWVNYGNTQTTQQALKLSVSRVVKWDTIRKKKSYLTCSHNSSIINTIMSHTSEALQ